MRSYNVKLQAEVTPPDELLEEFISPPLASQTERVTPTVDDYEQMVDGIWLLSAKYLRSLLHQADIEAGVARCFGDDYALDYLLRIAKFYHQKVDVFKQKKPQKVIRNGQVSIENVKKTHDIVDIIGKYTRLRKVGKEHMGECPFHNDKSPSLEVNHEKQLFYCFSCHRKGDVINFVMQIENLNAKQACLFLTKGLDNLTL